MITIIKTIESLCRYHNKCIAYFFFLILLPYLFMPMHANGTTIFKSGFEDGVTMSDFMSGTNWYKRIYGSDQGYDWETDLPGGSSNYWNLILNRSAYPKPSECLNFDISSNEAHTGSKSLYMRVVKECIYNSVNARIQYNPTINLWPYGETHIKYWVKFPSFYYSSMNKDNKAWNILSEIRYSSAGLRIMFQIQRDVVGEPLYWMLVADDIGNGWNPEWTVKNKSVPVPIDEWALLEIYLKARTYAQGNGVIWVKLNGEKILEKIPTANDRIMGDDGKLPSNWNFIKNYTYNDNIGFYIDDFQLYNTYTPTELNQLQEPDSGQTPEPPLNLKLIIN